MYTTSHNLVIRLVALAAIGALLCGGCQSSFKKPEKKLRHSSVAPPPKAPSKKTARAAPKRPGHKRPGAIVRGVRCLYNERPWLNLDVFGDRDPEGLCYRAFLDTGDGYGMFLDGRFDIEMYRIDPSPDGKAGRSLISDWHYPSSEVNTIGDPGMLGDGYVLCLRWAQKGLAGSEIEILTTFTDWDGNSARSATKRLRVPKYPS